MMTDFTIILRSLRLRLFSTITTALTVAVAICLLLVLLSLRDASRKAFDRGSGNMHLLVSADSSPMGSVLNAIFYANPPARALKWAACQELLKAYPVDYQIPIQQGDTYRSFPVVATTPGFFTQFKPDPESGWELTQGNVFKSEFEIVAGAAAAQALKLKLGDSFYITHGVSDFSDRDPEEAEAAGAAAPKSQFPTLKMAIVQLHRYSKYKVVGILKRTGTSHDRALFTDLNSTWIVHAHQNRRMKDPTVTHTGVADLKDADKLITGVYVRFKTPPGMSESPVLGAVYEELKRGHPEITVAVPAVEIDRLFSIVSNIDEIFIALAAVVMVSSGIAIMLALYNSMEQRRRQIAILRVMGCSQARVFGLVVTEAAVIGLLGAMAGVALSLIANQISAKIIDAKLGLIIQPALAAEPTMWVVLAAIVLAGVAGIVPALMAYRTPVARSLRPMG